MTDRSYQVGGDHYSKHKIQPWDVIDDHGLDFYEGNAVKYLLRADKGSHLEDLKKAVHYLEKAIELAEEAVLTDVFEALSEPEEYDVFKHGYITRLETNALSGETGKYVKIRRVAVGQPFYVDKT